MQKLDSFTLKQLELTAPGYCRQDAASLYEKLQQGLIFGSFGRSEREKIWENVLSVSKDRLIPSFQTFFDDVKYLKGPAECIKRLAGYGTDRTAPATLKRNFTDVGQNTGTCIFQVSETDFEIRQGSGADRLEIGYRTLWLYAMRNCLEMPAKGRKRGSRDRLAKSVYEEDETVLHSFAYLAHRLGFRSREIQALIELSADREIARNALLKARNPERYSYSAQEFDTHVEKIVALFNAISEASSRVSRAPKSIDSRFLNELPNRSGLPQLYHYVDD